MLYYRTSKQRIYPDELLGYAANGLAELHDGFVHGYRTLALSPPMHFDPPVDGWVQLPGSPEWQIASVGPFDPTWHIRRQMAWDVANIDVQGVQWLVPNILTPTGARAFKVVYGGSEFQPILTEQQQSALSLASEIRTCLSANTMPNVSVQAQWVARILPIAYHLSSGSIQVVGVSEELISLTCKIVAGYYESKR